MNMKNIDQEPEQYVFLISSKAKFCGFAIQIYGTRMIAAEADRENGYFGEIWVGSDRNRLGQGCHAAGFFLRGIGAIKSRNVYSMYVV